MNFKNIYKAELKTIFIVLLLSVLGCHEHVEKRYILLSKQYSDSSYCKWLLSFDDNLSFVDMYTVNTDSIDHFLSIASGIVMTGGADVSPDRYGKGHEIDRCGIIDLKRDSIESILIRYAFNEEIPILGICRGMQMLNIENGGSLIIDIPTDVGTTVPHRSDSITTHKVTLIKNSMLYKICTVDSGIIVSNHHQAMDKLAECFVPVAYSPDSLIEALELKDTTIHPFVLGVMWHPERMDSEHSLVRPIGERFVEKCLKL